MDSIKFTILKDGTIKVTTDAVSEDNHYNAEQFLKGVQELAGGPTKVQDREDRPVEHHHHHEEGHQHHHH